jgi:hypothetical protein
MQQSKFRGSDRVTTNAKFRDLYVLEKATAEELGMTTDERVKRIESLQQHEQRLKTRKQLLISLFEQHQTENKVELDKLEEVLKFIKLEDKKGDASVADIVKKVKLYLDKPLLKYISFMDTPGWNIDSKTFAEDYRLKRSQAQARDVDCWVRFAHLAKILLTPLQLYLTAAYENDPITENIRLMRSITKGTAPGAIAITGFDAVKDEKEKASTPFALAIWFSEFALSKSIKRAWCNGNIPAFQAGVPGSTPGARN